MALHHIYGIDIGTSTVKIYDQNNDSIIKEKNMIAIENNESVFAIGSEAYNLLGRTPQNIEVITPMSNGRISDISLMEAVLHTYLKRCPGGTGYRPTLIMSVPSDMTEIERRAYYTIAHRGSLRHGKLFAVEKPIADALSFGIPLSRTNGSMIINIGSQSTEISIIADSRVVISRNLPLGGRSINDAIVANVRRKNNLHISSKMAKRLKISLTDMNGRKMEGRKVVGIDTEKGIPRDGIITAYTVTDAVRAQIEDLTEEIKKFLERTPPQIRTCINQEGVYLCGGSTRIAGLGEFLNNHLECPVRLSGYYDLSTICGIKELVTHQDLMNRWTFPLNKRK
ncbi:MAG TPA: rod shape-determining protein [Lachnospiraceae bacterium]|nr:rod shape-determining protein [Lachnospiraceae bacterium]